MASRQATRPRTSNGPCAYCGAVTNIKRLTSSDLLNMMKESNPNYDRNSQFCNNCHERMITKYKQRQKNRRLLAKKAQTSVDDQTGSYSNASNPALSQSTSSRSPQRNRSDGNRNVAGPSNRSDRSNRPDSESGMRVDLSGTSSTNSSPQRPQNVSADASNTSRRSTRSQGAGMDLGNDDYDDDNNDNNANQTDSNSSVSNQAPMPTNRHQRTESLSAVTPSQLATMSSSERSSSFRNYNRGGGG